MSRTGTLRRNLRRDLPPGTVEYGSFVVLLSALTLLQILLGGAIRRLNDLSPYYVTAEVYGTLVYSVIGLALLGGGFLTYRRTRGDARLDDAGSVQLLLASSLAVVFVSSVVSDLVTPSTTLFGTFVISVVGTGLLSIAYLRARGVDPRLGAPDEQTLRTVAIAGLVPALLVVLSLVGAREIGSSPWLFGGRYARSVPILDLARNAALAASFAGFGAGLLFHGTIQETLREYATPAGAVAGITVTVGLHRGATAQLAALDGVALLLAVAPVVALVVLVASVVVRLWRLLDRTVSGTSSGTVTAAAFGAVPTAVLLAGWHVAFSAPAAWFGWHALVHTAAVGVAAVTYERSRSVWVPMLAIASFYATADIVPYLLSS